jgi:hypothetical protein
VPVWLVGALAFAVLGTAAAVLAMLAAAGVLG